jgi:integrase
MTSRVTPHCFRRAWATMALNDEKNPIPIDVVSEVLRHKEIATTRRHYAPTKSDRAQAALVGMGDVRPATEDRDLCELAV